MPRPNWFFAFPLDGAFVLTLPELPPGLRRYHPEDVHLTLAFLGDVPTGSVGRLRAIGDAMPQVFIPWLVEEYRRGRFPFDRLIRQYRLDEIDLAEADMLSGRTIKPVLRITPDPP